MNDNFKQFGRSYPSCPLPEFTVKETHTRFVLDDTGLCTSVEVPNNPNLDLDPNSFKLENQIANGQKLSTIPSKSLEGVLGSDSLTSSISSIID